MAIPYWAHILKGTRHFIFTQDADNLTKPKTEKKETLFQWQVFTRNLRRYIDR